MGAVHMGAVMSVGTDQISLLDRGWLFLVTMFVTLSVLTGGISIPSSRMVIFHTVISLCISVLALIRLARKGFPTKLALWGAVLLAGAIALLLLQLVPLPQSVWQTFPGRDLVLRNYALIGQLPGWAPLSLSPENTAADGIAMLPGIAAFLSVLTIASRQVLWICCGIIGCAVVSVGLGLLQNFEGADSIYYLYDSAGGVGVGTFNNRNFFAEQLNSSIPVLSGFAVAAQGRWRLKPILVVLFAVVYSAIILAGLSLSGSRTGVLLAMPAVLFAVILAYSRSSGQQRISSATVGMLAVLAGLLVVGQASMLGLLRLTQSDPLTDYRVTITKGAYEIALKYFPVGSGFGTFVPLYQLYETPETMLPEFVNHAHNDWLELVVEGGLPALFFLISFAIWLIFTEVRVWRFGQGGQTALFQRMASMIVPLLLIHSLVEFPLRTPALMVLFALCCGIMVLQPEISNGKFERAGRANKRPSTPPLASAQRKPFQRPETGFGAQQPGRTRDTDKDSLQ
jgi:O-antigen ligase